jgi:hypothetical protein
MMADDGEDDMPEQENGNYNVRLSNGTEFGPASLDLIAQWAREGRVPLDALLVSVEGGAIQSVLSVQSLKMILQAPPTVSTGVRMPPDDGVVTGMIPYKNPPALIGYYFGIFSLIPFLGALLGIVAIVLGVAGLIKRKNNPKVRGAVHAWVAIVLGAISVLGYGGFIMFAILNAN